MATYVVHYSEIALKGKNRRFFEEKLKENILKKVKCKIEKSESRFLLTTKESEKKVKEMLSTTPGVAYFAKIYFCKKDIEALKKLILKKIKWSAKTFAVKAKRSDKTFEMNSLEIEKEIGAFIAEKYKMKVDLKNPEKIIYIEVLATKILVYFDKEQGIGGLPVGTSGRALCLFSGGIDSPVAAIMMMKRGCTVDLLHFHNYSNDEGIKNSKIWELAEKLAQYQGRIKLYLAYYPFSSCTRIKYPMQVFRRFIIKAAEEITIKKKYDFIVTGESLGQVASQTAENIKIIEKVKSTSIPILRPLIGMNKQEIIDLAKRYGTYEISIKDYRDVCSNLSAQNAIYPFAEEIEKDEKRLSIRKYLEKSIENITEYEINLNGTKAKK